MKINEPEYQYAEDLINMTIKKLAPACILKSEGGLGKSYLVKTLCAEKCPKRYEYFSGHITPKQLFCYLQDNKDKIIVFDDVEDLLKSDVAVGILKGALWAVKGERTVKYATTEKDGTPSFMCFNFTGGIILLLNRIPRKNHPVIKALITRGLSYDIVLSYKKKIRIMEEILRNDDFHHLIGSNLSKEDRERLIKDLKENTSMAMDNFNFRTMEKLVMFYKYNNKDDYHIQLHNVTNRIDEDKDIVLKLLAKNIPIGTQVADFTAQTGKSRATFYRIKKAIELERKRDKLQEKVSKYHQKNNGGNGGKPVVKMSVSKHKKPTRQKPRLGVADIGKFTSVGEVPK